MGQGERSPRCFFAFLALCIVLLSPLRAADAPTVGIEGQLTVLLPGPELKAIPAERTAPLWLLIESTRPHGSLVQFVLRYIVFVAGLFVFLIYML